jgi:hypothetical protein
MLSPRLALADLSIDAVIRAIKSHHLAEIKEMSQEKFYDIGIDQ